VFASSAARGTRRARFVVPMVISGI
jgi:hypothetical protein